MGAFDIVMTVFGTVATIGIVVIGVMTFGGIVVDMFKNRHTHKHA